MRGFPYPVWKEGRYAVYRATKEHPLPAGMRCISSSDVYKAINMNVGDEFYGIMLRSGLTTGYAKYLIDESKLENNELGEISL